MLALVRHQPTMAENDPSKWRLVEPNWRIPVDDSEIVGSPTSPVRVSPVMTFISKLWGGLVLICLFAWGVFGISHLLDLEQVGFRDALGISAILIFMRGLDKTTFGKVS